MRVQAGKTTPACRNPLRRTGTGLQEKETAVSEEVIRFFLLQRLVIKANQPIEREGNLPVRIRSMKKADHRKIDSALGSQVILNTKDNWVFILRGGNNETKEELSV